MSIWWVSGDRPSALHGVGRLERCDDWPARLGAGLNEVTTVDLEGTVLQVRVGDGP